MKINLPIIVADDYHEFDFIKTNLNKILINEVNAKKSAIEFKEIGADKDYYAYFYDATLKLSPVEIVKTFLKNYSSPKSKEEEVKEFAKNILNSSLIKELDLAYESLKTEGFYNTKPKKKM